MDLKRYMFIVLILLVCMVSISAVSAVDDATDDIISADNEEIILDEAIDDDVSSANDNYDDELILEDAGADNLVGNANEETPIKDSATGSFSDLNKLINEDYSSNDTITLSGNYKFTDGDDDYTVGIHISRGVTIDGNGFILDGSNSARIFHVNTGGEVTFKNINFINGHATGPNIAYYRDGGAIFFESCSNNNIVINCNFTNNIAEYDGGAIYAGGDNLEAINCTFIQNTAKVVYGGAMRKGTAINCTFIQNTAKYGGAMIRSTAINCTFINNTAQNSGAMIEGTAVLCRFVEDSDTTYDTNIITPAFSVSDLTTEYNSGEKLMFNLTADNTNYDGFNTIIKIYQAEQLVGTYYALTGEDNGWVVDLSPGTYKAVLSLDSHPEVEPADATLTIKTIPDFSIEDIECDYGETISIRHILSDGATGTIKYFLSDETFLGELDVNQNFTYPYLLNAGSYTIIANYSGDGVFSNASATASLTINKAKAVITPTNPAIDLFVGDSSKVEYTLNPEDAVGDVTFTSSNPDVVSVDSTGAINAMAEGTATITINFAESRNYKASSATINVVVSKKATSLTASAVTTTYNVAKDLVITLKDADGNPISCAKVTVDLNGAKNYTTDKNGQVKVAVGKLVPKTYTAKISFAGDDIYKASSTTAKVTVKKATPKLTSKAKTFKFEDKTKKYTVTLKDNKGNVLKNKKVTLKVNGKTYTAKTNSKGVATFKLTKLNKKGKFSAVVTYAGDKYYNKVTKEPKITVKAPAWKTVSKGSKDKATVKKIQKALKDNGYYLTYKGHYLKIDGIYDSCTVRSVKQFQKAKKLQMTGKVDYATAKKLKLVS